MNLGTSRHILIGALALLACHGNNTKNDTAEQPSDGGWVIAHDAAHIDAKAVDAASKPATKDAGDLACRAHADCELIPENCCPSCTEPKRADWAAVRYDSLADHPPYELCTDVVCNACVAPPYNPLAPIFRAACVAGQCTVINLRVDDSTRCAEDSDCVPVKAGCCPSCTGDPAQFVALNTHADGTFLSCRVGVQCRACEQQTEPNAFCATDGHCGLRAN